MLSRALGQRVGRLKAIEEGRMEVPDLLPDEFRARAIRAGYGVAWAITATLNTPQAISNAAIGHLHSGPQGRDGKRGRRDRRGALKCFTPDGVRLVRAYQAACSCHTGGSSFSTRAASSRAVPARPVIRSVIALAALLSGVVPPGSPHWRPGDPARRTPRQEASLPSSQPASCPPRMPTGPPIMRRYLVHRLLPKASLYRISPYT
jgi:hypothetical protein